MAPVTSAGSVREEFFDFAKDALPIDAQVYQHGGRHAATDPNQSQQNVLRPDVLATRPRGLLVGELHHLSDAVGE